MKKNLLTLLLLAFIVIQFFRPEKNINKDVDPSKSALTIFPANDNVKMILQKSCNDCHTQNTKYPWYNHIQPVMWYLSRHINEGKKHLNLDLFADYSLAKQFHKLEEIGEVLDEDEMPLTSYTIIHRDAKLNAEDKKALKDWAGAAMTSMKARYPADSLVMPKRK